jgi:hypothetical protein
MKCPHCGIAFQTNSRKDYTRPLFGLLILLLVVFFIVGIRMQGENEGLKLKMAKLEKSVEYYEATLFQYQQVIEQFTRSHPEKKNY